MWSEIKTPADAVAQNRAHPRGGKVDVLEGEWSPKRLVVLEFESAEKAKQWWSSQEYSIPKQIRQKTSVTNLIVVEGA